MEKNKMRKLFFLILFITCLASVSSASDVIITDANVFRPIKNSWQSIQGGDAPVYDDGNGPFFGIFEIKFALDKTQYYGNIKIEVQVQKSGDAWKKIAEITPAAKPSSGDWTTTFYWNSREAAYEWTSTDEEAFKTNLKIKFKVIEQ